MKLKHHPELWLSDDAARAIDLAEDERGILTINSAGRTPDEQQHLINRWDEGGQLNRPPHLYNPARPKETSRHVAQGGIAVDVSEWRTFKEYSHEYGYIWWGESDPVHFEFIGMTFPSNTEKESDMLIINIQGRVNIRKGGAHVLKDGKLHHIGDSVTGQPTLNYDQGTAIFKLYPQA